MRLKTKSKPIMPAIIDKTQLELPLKKCKTLGHMFSKFWCDFNTISFFNIIPKMCFFIQQNNNNMITKAKTTKIVMGF